MADSERTVTASCPGCATICMIGLERGVARGRETMPFITVSK